MSSVTCNAAGLPPLARCHEGADGDPQPEQRAVNGEMWAVDGAQARFQSGHSALVTLPDAKRRQALCTAHRSKWASTVTYWAICASASNSLTRDAHVTDDTARHLRYTSRAKREADVSLSHRCTMEHHRCTMEHHDATGVSPRDKRCES